MLCVCGVWVFFLGVWFLFRVGIYYLYSNLFYIFFLYSYFVLLVKRLICELF